MTGVLQAHNCRYFELIRLCDRLGIHSLDGGQIWVPNAQFIHSDAGDRACLAEPIFRFFFFARTIIFLSFIILVHSWKYVGWLTTDDSPSHCSHVPVGVLCKCWGGLVPNYMFQNASFVWPYHHQWRLSLSSLWSHFEQQSSYSELLLPTNALAFANSMPCISRKRDIILSTSSW